MVIFNPRILPFSRFGAALSLYSEGNDCLVLQNNRRHRARLLELRFGTGALGVLACTGRPEELEASTSQGTARIAVEGDRSIILQVKQCALVMDLHAEADGFGVTVGDHFRFYSSRAQCVVTVSTENARATAEFHREPKGHVCRQIVQSAKLTLRPDSDLPILVRISISDHDAFPSPDPIDFPAVVDAVAGEWSSFLEQTPTALQDEPCQRAWYTLWSSTLRSEGHFTRNGVLMSKRLMTGIWSWDHCFNGLALALADSQQGLDQIRLPFELQAANGALPDVMQVTHSRWIFSKPPIHGWALSQFTEITPDERKWFYEKLSRSTNWWMTHRDLDGTGVPVAIHPNDAGWDNSTLFDTGEPLASPDLAAYLVLQMEWLSETAATLGLNVEAASWSEKAFELTTKLLEVFWDGDQFCARAPFSGLQVRAPLCLQTCMPIVLGSRLPRAVFEKLAARIENNFLTDSGPATESPKSVLYVEDGYWRGPVWAPSTHLIVAGLMHGKATRLAHLIAQRYCQMIERSQGFFENHSATDGRGLCDPGYTWTASVYLLLRRLISPKHSSGPDGSNEPGPVDISNLQSQT